MSTPYQNANATRQGGAREKTTMKPRWYRVFLFLSRPIMCLIVLLPDPLGQIAYGRQTNWRKNYRKGVWI